MASERFNFTKAGLAAVAVPDKGLTYVYDTNQKAPSLCMAVTPKGARTFYWYGRIDGKPERVKLGRFDKGMTVDQARRKARETQTRVDKGENPQAEKRVKRADLTLGGLFERFKTEPSARTKQPKRVTTINGYQKQWDKHLARWEKRKLSTIKHSDVERLHQRIGETAPYQANRVLALLAALYRMAPKHGYTGPDPTRGIQRFPERSRVRYLSPAEAKRFFAALDDEPNQTLADALRVALFTGARRSNVQSMRWDQIDMAEGVWKIPEGEAKAGEAIEIPLPPPAMEVLKRRRKGKKSVWVFPSKRGDAGHIMELKSAMSRVLKAAKIDDFRIHDLRHTLASWMVNNGAGLELIGKQLGHKSVQTTAKYAHVSLDPVRESVTTATAALVEAGREREQQEKPGRKSRRSGRRESSK